MQLTHDIESDGINKTLTVQCPLSRAHHTFWKTIYIKGRYLIFPEYNLRDVHFSPGFIFYMEKEHVKGSHSIKLIGPGDFSLLTHMLRWWMVYETKRIRVRVRVCMMYCITFLSLGRMMVIGFSPLPTFLLQYILSLCKLLGLDSNYKVYLLYMVEGSQPLLWTSNGTGEPNRAYPLLLLQLCRKNCKFYVLFNFFSVVYFLRDGWQSKGGKARDVS